MQKLRGMRVAVSALVLAVICLGFGSGSPSGGRLLAGEPAPGFPVVTFTRAGGGTAVMSVEVADAPKVEQCGLGHRFWMPEDHGMLFVGERESAGAFWDRNTFIPLTLAWMAPDGTILQLMDMAAISPYDVPQFNTLYAPAVRYLYVIEANQGWFDRNGVQVGDRADLSEALAIVGTQGERETLCDQFGY